MTPVPQGGEQLADLEVHPADGKGHAGFSATTVINRNDFGVDFNMPLGMDTLVLGKRSASSWSCSSSRSDDGGS